MDREKDDRTEIERRVVADPRVEFDHVVREVGDPIAAFAKPRLDPPVQHLPQRGNADHSGDVAVLDRPRQVLGGQLVEICDLRSVRKRRQKSGRKFERVMHRQHGQDAVRDVHIEHDREHRHHVREILVRQHHRLWRAGRAGSKDQRRDRCSNGSLPEASALRFASSISLGISKTSSNVQTGTRHPVSISAWRVSSPSAKPRSVSLPDPDSPPPVSGLITIADASPAFAKCDDLVDRACRIDRDGGRTGFENAEIGHSPFGHVVREQNDAARPA